MGESQRKSRILRTEDKAMKFRSAAFWLFLLTVGGNHRQLSSGGCWGVAAEITQKAASELHQGNELENALKLRATPKQTRFIGDITTPSTDATAPKSIGHQPMRRAKATSADQNLEHHFKQSVVQLFDSDEHYESSEAAITEGGDDDGATATISAANSAEATTTHHPGRRHVVPDKLQYTKEIQVKQGRLMGITRRFQVTSGLRQVDQFLGLPYAEAPTGSRRFMPPGG